MPEALWSLERKCSETVVGLELFVCLSTGLRCSLKRSLKGPSQPHLCFCLYAGVWLLYLIRSMSKWTKSL